MACDAQSVETLTVFTDNLYKLSERQWLECLANLFGEIAATTIGLPLDQTAVNLAYSLGYSKLSDVQLEQAILAAFTASAYDAQTIVTEIASKGYDKLSHADLRRCIVAAICAGVAGTAQTVETLAINTDKLNRLSEYDADLGILSTLCAAKSSQCLPPSLLHWRGNWAKFSDRGLREVIAAVAQYSVIVTNPLTTLWLNNITNNGGPPPSPTTGTAINTFLNTLDACGITSKILRLAIFVPDSLIAATTPLIVGGGNNPWGNTNFVGGDLSVNGITGNGANKYLDPGITPAFAGAQWTLTSCCAFFYAYTANSTALGTETGCTDGANDAAFVSNFNFGGLACFSDLMGVGARLSVATPGNGFYMASRIAAGDNKIYFANSTTPWSAIASNAAGSSGFSTAGFLIYAFNNNGAVSQYANSVLSCSGYAAGLTTTEGQCLYNAIQACRVALGGGFR